ncbi:jg16079, partial [Pararge aegeria aegeria]
MKVLMLIGVRQPNNGGIVVQLRWSQMVGGKKNVTASGCDLDADQHDLAA